MSEKKISGMWWICSEGYQDNPRVHGTLSIAEDRRMELNLTPSWNELSLPCKWSTSYVIWGEDVYGGKITLFNVYLKEIRGRSETLQVNYALIGVHIASADTPIVTKVEVRYPNLNDFFFVQNADVHLEGNTVTFTLQPPPQNKLVIPLNGVCWSIDGYYQWRTRQMLSEINILQYTRFIIQSRKAKSLNFFKKQIDEFTNFLSLALYSKQRFSEICFYTAEDESRKCELIFQLEPSSKVFYHLIGNSVPPSRLTDILKNWHNNYSEIAPIYRYLERSQFYHQGLGGIPEFLLIEFAIEGYFKRFHNKIKTPHNKDRQKLAEQLALLCDYYKEVSIIASLNLDIDAIVNTRDTYVHLRPESERAKNELRDSHDIWIATEKLKMLLLCCLLDNMGFTMEEIDTNFNTSGIQLPEVYQNDFLF